MKYTEIFKEARRLYDLGFAIHWLHPKSKRPVESGWGSGPRKEWSELERTFKAGYNVGVRLGSPSKLASGYLGVVDLDIKSKEERHRTEALSAATGLVGGASCPIVASGRGGGSRHFYCVTAEPFKTFNPAQSEEMVKVHQPSKKPSKAELKQLTPDEIESGVRLSRAWEVSLYSDGRQVVLPPSVHPDSGKLYAWERVLKGAKDLPELRFNGAAKRTTISKGSAATTTIWPESDFDFTPKEVEIAWLPISDEVRDAIVSGKGVTDRSAYLMRASNALVSAGLDQDEVLSVLTDPTTYLGACAYEHAQTKDRARAAAWAYRYTLKKVTGERDVTGIFGALPKPVKLTEEEMEAQAEELEIKAWRSEEHGFYLRGPKGGLIPDYKNLLYHYQLEHPYRSVADMKTVYLFNGTHYEDTTPIEIKAFAEQYFKPSPEDKIRNEFWNKVLVNNVIRRRFFIETTEGKINFKNGILDLNQETQALSSHSSEIGFRGVLPYDYDPAAKCPRFKAWLRSVMLDDQDLVDILQEFMGYVIRGGDYKYHKALWVGGTGRNGKSTFIDVMKALIGPGNFSTLSIKSLITDKFAGSDLDGKIANFSEETSPEEIADSGPFKNLTGDGDISAQKKFGDIYSFRNRAKLIMSYNTIPNLKDLSPGMLSRPLIVPFKKVIAETDQDHGIKKKLFTEMSGIFNFALEGWRRLEEQNQFTHSDQSEEALQTIKEESCNVTQWINHYVDFLGDDEGTEMRVTDLYELYKQKEKYPFGLSGFGRKLKAHPELGKRWNHDRFGASYRGIRVR